MATMTFERIVPSGKNAYFPFQMSAGGLNPTATVFINDDAAAGGGVAHNTVSSGVTVVDLGGGLYALKVLSSSMTANTVYYGVVTKGNETVRIPMFAYAPADHIAKVLSDLAVVDGVVDDLKTEIGDVSAQSFDGIAAPATVAAALATIFNKVDGVQDDLDNATDGLGALKTLIESETTAIDSALTTIDNEIAALQGDVTSILADTNELQGDWANGGRLDLLLDRTVVASEAAEDLIGLATDNSAAATVFGKIAALSSDVATVDGNVDSIKSSIENNTYGLSALKGHIDDVDTAVAALDAKVVTVDTVVDGIASALANGTNGLAALKSEIDANETKIDILDTNLDSVKASIENATYGLSALETKVMTVDTVVDGIASALANGTTGLAALKSEIDANEAKLDIIDTVVDGIATEIGDVSAVFGGATPPANVAEALKEIYDNLAGSDVWDDDLSTYTTAGTAGYLLREAHEELTDAGHGLAAIKAETASIQTDTTALLVDTSSLLTKLGDPAGASLSVDIAAIKAVVDTLQVTTNARLTPSVPSEVYSSSAAFRVKLGLVVHDGTSGALDDPDTVGGGKAMIAVQAVGSATALNLFDGSAPGASALATNSTYSGFKNMAQVLQGGAPQTGRFEAYVELPAYFNYPVEVQFMCFDSDPQAQQTFTTSRYMVVRSQIQATFAGGAF